MRGSSATLFFELFWWSLAAAFLFSTFYLPPKTSNVISLGALPFLFLFRHFWNKMMKSFTSWEVLLFDSTSTPGKIPLILFSLLWLLYFANISIGVFKSPDTEVQWQQVLNFQFDDWHPITHTFCIWLITCIYRSYLFFLFVQATLYAFVVTMLYKVLLKYCHIRKDISLAVALLISLHPAMMNHLCVAWKDTAMAIAFLGITVCLIPLAVTRGKWLQSPVAMLTFILLVLLGSLFRHNAIFFTFPLLFFLVFSIERKFLFRYILTALSILILYTSVQGGIRFYTQQQSAPSAEVSQTYIEVIGIPLGILANTATKAPYRLPDDVRNFMLDIAPFAEWQKYREGNFNYLKFKHYQSLTNSLSRVPPAKFASMVIRTSLHSPQSAISAIFNHIIPFWTITTWPGFQVALLLFAGLLTFPLLRWQILPFFFPVFCYQAGTSLLMSSIYDTRFYLYAIPVCLPTIVLLLTLHYNALSGRETEKVPEQKQKFATEKE